MNAMLKVTPEKLIETAGQFQNTDDMERLYALIRKHADELTEMANEYRQAEEESSTLASSLATEAVI